MVSTSNKEGYLNVFAGKDIIQLKNNSIPKGLVPLEELFDKNDVAKILKRHQRVMKWKILILVLMLSPR